MLTKYPAEDSVGEDVAKKGGLPVTADLYEKFGIGGGSLMLF